MTTIVLFHHVLGLTDGVKALAESLRDNDHEVLTPDLFNGCTFDSLPAGLGYVGEIGDDELLRRAEQACAGLASEVVYAGLSSGVVAAQHMLQTKPGARGGLLLHSFIEPTQLAGSWPDQCPVDVFAMQHDPFFVEDGDLAAAQQWQTTHPNLRIHLYPGTGHLFTEPASPDHDAATTQQLVHDIITTVNPDRTQS